MQIGKNPFGQANFLDAFPLSFRGALAFSPRHIYRSGFLFDNVECFKNFHH